MLLRACALARERRMEQLRSECILPRFALRAVDIGVQFEPILHWASVVIPRGDVAVMKHKARAMAELSLNDASPCCAARLYD